jgi:hypothetical protein
MKYTFELALLDSSITHSLFSARYATYFNHVYVPDEIPGHVSQSGLEI